MSTTPIRGTRPANLTPDDRAEIHRRARYLRAEAVAEQFRALRQRLAQLLQPNQAPRPAAR
jgi:predicted component of type VI protein secretion system